MADDLHPDEGLGKSVETNRNSQALSSSPTHILNEPARCADDEAEAGGTDGSAAPRPTRTPPRKPQSASSFDSLQPEASEPSFENAESDDGIAVSQGDEDSISLHDGDYAERPRFIYDSAKLDGESSHEAKRRRIRGQEIKSRGAHSWSRNVTVASRRAPAAAISSPMRMSRENRTNRSKIRLVAQESHGMLIFVKMLTGKTSSVRIEAEDKISELKIKIEAESGIPSDEQRLVFAGKYLSDDRTISSYNIQKESYVHLIRRLESVENRKFRGGRRSRSRTSSVRRSSSEDSTSNPIHLSNNAQVVPARRNDQSEKQTSLERQTSLGKQTPLDKQKSHRYLIESYRDYREDVARTLQRLQNMEGNLLFNEMQISRWTNETDFASTDSDPQESVCGFITNFGVEDAAPISTLRVKVSSITRSDDGLCEMEKQWTSEYDDRRPAFRWVHLPANNMEWVTDAMFQILNYDTGEPYLASQLQSSILSDEHWKDKQVVEFGGSSYFKSMGIYCAQIETRATSRYRKMDSNTSKDSYTSDADSLNSFDRDSHAIGPTWVLYMPFLHWEHTLANTMVSLHVQSISDGSIRSSGSSRDQLTSEEIFALPCSPDEKLLRHYVDRDEPLHLRRPLTSYFLDDVHDPSEKDLEQVVDMYSRKHLPGSEKGPPMLVVDQLWIWMIEGTTILTCFPQRWNTASGPDEQNEVIEDLLMAIGLAQTQGKIRGIQDLAGLIIDRCGSNLFENGYSTPEQLRCPEIISRSLNELSTARDTSYRAFWHDIMSSRADSCDDIFDILKEYEMLQRTRNILNELQILIKLQQEQYTALTQFDGMMKQARTGGQFTKLDPARLINKAMSRLMLLSRLTRRGESIYQLVQNLLSAKQHQANVLEARSSRKAAQQMEILAREAELATVEDRRQGDAIMLFTAVTIIFLPFSSLTSVFGMNAVELGQGQVPLGILFAYIIPISGTVVLMAFFLAFNRKARCLLILILRLIAAYFCLSVPSNILDGVLASLEEKTARLRAQRKRKCTSHAEVEHISGK